MPICSTSKPNGVVILKDTLPEEKENVSAVKVPMILGDEDAEPPEPFEWTPPDSSAAAVAVSAKK